MPPWVLVCAAIFQWLDHLMTPAATARKKLNAQGLPHAAILRDEPGIPAQAPLRNFSFLFLLSAGTSITRARRRGSTGIELPHSNRIDNNLRTWSGLITRTE